jgi:eukaryotic-like serine/threonine-protein kinase
MPKRLLVVAGPDKGKAFPLSVTEPLLVGRSKATATRLTDPHVSRVHCQIEMEGDRVMVNDFESAGGTFVNNRKINQQEIKPGDIIRIGETQLRYQDDDAGEPSTMAPTVTPSPKPGVGFPDNLTELSGKSVSYFEVGPVLAKGHTGVIFKARDTKENREVALKILWPEISKVDDEMQRFIRAMKTMLPLRHPNLVAIYGAGKTGPYCWMSMEYVEGESLTQVIQRIGVAGLLDWRNAVRVATHVARALEYAQEHQIIHRNITPNNILVRSSDKLTKLADLMLAKAMEGTLAESITKPGELIGDISYISPERTKGSLAEVDGRSDIYSLGATLYALLTVRKIRQSEPEKPKKFQLSIPDQFEGVVLKMLAKRPEDRFQTAAELLKDLERVAKFQGVAV